MKPQTQASNIEFCDIQSRYMTVKWDKGSGDKRIVTIAEEKVVKNKSKSSNTSTNNDGFNSTPENPDPLEVRQFWPGYEAVNFGGTSNKKSSSCKDVTYLAPSESLPLDGEEYEADIKYGEGSELFETERGTTSSNPSDCPEPSPSPSPSPVDTEWETAKSTGVSTGTFVVYNDTGEEVTIIGLKPETGYYVTVYEYNEDCLEYNWEANTRLVVTSCEDDCYNFQIFVEDCRTCRPVVSMVYVLNRYNKVVDKGSTDRCGYYSSDMLEVGAYTIKVEAPNYDTYFIRNAFIKKDPEQETSVLHPHWTQGTFPRPYRHVDDKDKRVNCYNAKL